MPTRARRLKFHMLFWVATALIGLAVLAMGLTVWQLRSDAVEEAAQDAGSIATLLAEQTARSVQSIDLILTELQERVAGLGVRSADDFERMVNTSEMYRLLTDRLGRLPQADVITLAGSDGQLVNSTRSWPRAHANFFDRDYFQQLMKNRDGEIYVNPPVTSRLTGDWIIFFNKRISGQDGTFLGVASVGVKIDYLKNIYEAIASLRHRSFLFLRTDGTVLVRHPDPTSRAGRTMPAGSPWYALVAQGGGYYRSPGYFDDQARFVAVRPVRGYPLVVNVAVAENAALANWRRRAAFIGGGTLLAVFCAIVLSAALTAQVRRLLESEISLAEREAKLTEQSRDLASANEQLDAALNNMSQGLCMFDQEGRLVVCNGRFLETYGLPAEIIKPGCTVRDILEFRSVTGTLSAGIERYLEDLFAHLARGQVFAAEAHSKDGRVISVVNLPIPGGGWVGTHEDITERRRTAARIAHLARHDALTDLANRALFWETMDEALTRLRQRHERFCVFVFDLNLFKSVNDSFGHPIGDQVLKGVAERLRAAVPESDTIARLGGDEFAILHSIVSDGREESIVLANRLLKTICEPYKLDGNQIVIGISIGIALAPDNGADADQLLKNADLALYRAKSEGGNRYRFFSTEMDAEMRVRRALQADLCGAVSRSQADGHSEFVLHYQDIINVTSGEICGAEALVRWHHPSHGLLGPDKFIPLAEEISVIIPLGEWIIRKACSDAARWPSHIKLAVNLSPAQFLNDNLVDVVVHALESSGIAPERLELEITESVLLQKSADNLSILHQLKGLGISIVLDDFGTGYSSLSYLRLFPFNKIKIDRSFVAELSSRADCAAIVCAMTNLGRSLDIDTTGEGVETHDQFELLRAAGCTQAQGYLFSRPRPASEMNFTSLTARGEKGAAA
jgi:diguanylate cyclase (GGDEF)-like protein